MAHRFVAIPFFIMLVAKRVALSLMVIQYLIVSDIVIPLYYGLSDLAIC